MGTRLVPDRLEAKDLILNTLIVTGSHDHYRPKGIYLEYVIYYPTFYL